MKTFSFKNAATIEEASSLLKAGRAAVFAGGTDILTVLKAGALTEPPQILVNIKKISGLNAIKETKAGLEIGSLTKLCDIVESPLINNKLPVLARAAAAVGSPQIRNMGTIGGNLCQEVQCWYWRRSFSTGIQFECLRKGGKECFAVTGDARYHSIIGGRGCFAVCPSDTAIALTALNAEIITSERKIPIGKFYRVMGNVLKKGEIIMAIIVPEPLPGTRQTFTKYALRPAIDFAIVSVATAIVMAGEKVTSSNIVLGGVNPIPYQATGAEKVIKGKQITETLADEAAEAALKAAIPLTGPANPTGQKPSNKFKIPIAKTLIKRAILSSTQV
jgi:xanthine dehydrogenase YagS FAD-binding subunit